MHPQCTRRLSGEQNSGIEFVIQRTYATINTKEKHNLV